jgi:hypothetical protein
VTTAEGRADRSATVRDLIARQSDPQGGPAGLLRRVCRAASGELSASGVGISVLTEGGVRGVCAASDARSERREELQFILGEGPCMDAFDGRRPVLVADLTDGAMIRWPFFAPAVYDDGVRAVFAFPLQIGAGRLGMMDVFRERAGALSADELATALTFADVTVEALLDHQEDGVFDGLGLDVGHRAQVFQAQGMVMVQLGVTLGEALVRMRAYAYSQNCRLDDVARQVVDRTLSFDRDRE